MQIKAINRTAPLAAVCTMPTSSSSRPRTRSSAYREWFVWIIWIPADKSRNLKIWSFLYYATFLANNAARISNFEYSQARREPEWRRDADDQRRRHHEHRFWGGGRDFDNRRLDRIRLSKTGNYTGSGFRIPGMRPGAGISRTGK